jgi:hypothetical protein
MKEAKAQIYLALDINATPAPLPKAETRKKKASSQPGTHISH